MLRRLFFLPITLVSYASVAQVGIAGTVYDKTLANGIDEVNVFTNHGEHAVSDSTGHYIIIVHEADTLYFSYLKKQTQGFAVRDIHYPAAFDVSMDVVVQGTLAPVLVTHNSYELDSLENRKLWQKTFDYGQPAVLNNMRMSNGRGMREGVGLDFDQLFFNKDAQRSMERMQEWLITEEKENYIDHRWNKRLVGRITGLDSAALVRFMKEYRPSYEYLQGLSSEYEFYKDMKLQCETFLAARRDSVTAP